MLRAVYATVRLCQSETESPGATTVYELLGAEAPVVVAVFEPLHDGVVLAFPGEPRRLGVAADEVTETTTTGTGDQISRADIEAAGYGAQTIDQGP